MPGRGLSDDKREHKVYDLTDSSALYIGSADFDPSTGSAPDTSAPAWTIRKITLTAGSPTASTWTYPGGGIWDNRTTETYL